jgi:hypothetical protein
MKSLKEAASEELKLSLDLSRGARTKLKSPIRAIGPVREAKISSREFRKSVFWA